MSFTELERFAEKYNALEFVPFPSPSAAVDSITETAAEIFLSTDKEVFVDEVIRMLQEWKRDLWRWDEQEQTPGRLTHTEGGDS